MQALTTRDEESAVMCFLSYIFNLYPEFLSLLE